MFRVGLTGGIGSGKSTVANTFASLDTPVIDTDQIAHQLVEPGQEALQLIIKHFGTAFLHPDGSLNRHRLARAVFADPAQRKQLEAILHPRILVAMQAQIGQLDTPYCILVIPLLLESGWQGEVDRILVVDLPTELQISRVQARDGRSSNEVQAIINIQVSRQQRLAAADDIIDNSQDEGALLTQIQALHQDYLRRAQSSA